MPSPSVVTPPLCNFIFFELPVGNKVYSLRKAQFGEKNGIPTSILARAFGGVLVSVVK